MRKFEPIQFTSHQTGQGLLEYALILVLVVLVVIGILAVSGTNLSDSYRKIVALQGTNISGSDSTPEPGVTETVEVTMEPTTPAFLQTISDLQALMLAYYDANGKWPRKAVPKNFTDLGLDPAAYAQPVDGLYFSPNGNEVEIMNQKGDSIQMYATDLDGNTVQVPDGKSILCPVNDIYCYVGNVAPKNKVDPGSIYATGY
jgi:Flp pilus assembly pilin Flp